MAYNFIHRILNAEIPPPSSAWDKIAAALDKSQQPGFIDKLSNASIDPPASAWNNIAATLDGTRIERRAGVIPSWMKWSAAALVAGLVVLSATYFFNGRSSDSRMAAGSTPNEKSVKPSNQNAEQGTTSNSKLAENNVSSSEAHVVTTNDKERRARRTQVSIPVRHAVIEPPEQQSIDPGNESQPSISDNVSPAAAKYIPAPDYYVVTAPNGERTRISTKFSDAVVSLMGGDNVDYLWKSKFDNWKTKLISSPSFIPAAGNFLDIAELKDLIKEQ